MAKRLARRVAVAVPVAGVLMLGISATPAAAEKPHAPGTKGNPHAGATGNPHVPSSDSDNTSGNTSSVDSSASTTSSSTSSSASNPSSSSGSGGLNLSSASTFSAAKNTGGGGGGGGKPADGTVGNANRKKPTHTKDNGYECNGRNNGIGKGNPAHSACTNTTTTPTTTTTTPTTTNTTVTTTDTTPDDTVVLGETITRPAAATKVLGVSVSRGTLARTGPSTGDPVDLTFLAFGLIGLGFIVRKLAVTG